MNNNLTSDKQQNKLIQNSLNESQDWNDKGLQNNDNNNSHNQIDNQNYDEQDSLSRAIAEKEAELQKENQHQNDINIPSSRDRRNRANRQNEQIRKKSGQDNEQIKQNDKIDQSGCWNQENSQLNVQNQQQKKQQGGRRRERGRITDLNKQVQNKEQKKVQDQIKDDESEWDKQSVKQQIVQNNRRNRGRNVQKQQEQAQIQPDKVLDSSDWNNNEKKTTEPSEPQSTRRGNRRGNRENNKQQQNQQTQLNLNRNGDRRGNRDRGNRQQQRDFNDNGNRNFRRDNYNNDDRRQQRDFNAQRGGFGQRGGFKGGFRGGRGGFRNNDRRQGNQTNNNFGNFNNRRYNNQENGQRNFKKNQNNSVAQLTTVNASIPVKSIQPQANYAWPQVSIWIRKCKLTLTLRTLRQHEGDVLFFPFYDTTFTLYPSSLINKCGNIRKHIEEKLKTDYFDKRPCVKEIKQFGAFKYVSFAKVQKDKQELGVLQFLGSLFGSSIKAQSFIIPICKQFGDFKKILEQLETYIQNLQIKKALMKQIYLTTKDPQYFKQTSKIFTERINGHIDANRFCFE